MDDSKSIHQMDIFLVSFRPAIHHTVVFDSARSHISKRVKEHLQTRQILYAVIPGGLTGLLQPCDVYWFKNLKESISNSIDKWRLNPDKQLTKIGTIKPPSNEDMAAWLKEGLRVIGSQKIIESFSECFLGECIDLHISQHEIYGMKFRLKIAVIHGTTFEIEAEGA
jgi:hypothetical protein